MLINIKEHASDRQIKNFKPTSLYIKQHTKTGLMYFGKTVSKNPEKYKGSGKFWSRHIKKYGEEHVVTLWFCCFTDITTLVETAISLSANMDICNTALFANLIVENGLDGGFTGPMSDEFREHLRNNPFFKGRNHTEDSKKKMSDKKIGIKNPAASKTCSERTGENHPLYGKGHTEDSKKRMSESAFKKYQTHPPYARTDENKEMFRTMKWITDGSMNKRLQVGQEMPLGFTYGKCRRKPT